MAYKVFLSPSNQPNNRCALGHSEKEHCEELAHKLSILLNQRGIETKFRNTSKTLTVAVNEANAWGADLYLPMHTNALNGNVRGSRFGYASGRGDSKSACEVFQKNFRKIYPSDVKLSIYTFSESTRPKCPSVYCETVFHDNLDDAQWYHANMDRIAQNFVESIVKVIEAPTEPPVEEVMYLARVNTQYDEGISLWSTTSKDKRLIRVPKGEVVEVIADHANGWVTASYQGVTGFADKQYLVLAEDIPVEPEPIDHSALIDELDGIANRIKIITAALRG
jgi:hypothetical protein